MFGSLGTTLTMARKSSPRSATATAPVEFRADSPEVLAIIAAKRELAAQGPAASQLAEAIAPSAPAPAAFDWNGFEAEKALRIATLGDKWNDATAPTPSAVAETVTVAPETAHSVIAKALPTITNQAELVALLSRLQSFKPEKPVFSSDKATRKGQMVAFKIADKSFRSALGKVYRHAEDLGWGVHADRHAASVTKTGIVTLRRSESLKIAPSGHRFSL